MTSPKNQATLKALSFLRKKASDQGLFSAEQLGKAAGWSESSVRTYLSKKLGQLVHREGGKYRAKVEILRLKDEQFLGHMTQVKPVFTKYRRTKHDNLLTYEFLLPLTREDQLRRTLDDLFYSDTISRRLMEIGLNKLEVAFPRAPGLSDGAYVSAVVGRASRIAGGYSISHTNGRFRAADLVSRAKAGKILSAEGRYLVDETTAVVRFLVPLQEGSVELPDEFEDAKKTLDLPAPVDGKALALEIRSTRLLFFQLFVEAVARTVDGEDEIWLIEESPEGRRLYRWSRDG